MAYFHGCDCERRGAGGFGTWDGFHGKMGLLRHVSQQSRVEGGHKALRIE